MSSEGSIRTTHLWKRFRADIRFSKLRYEIQHVRAIMRGQGADAWRWALRDINFEAQPGEAIALIGTNGSGKSTLLKVLTRVMYPHSGTVEIAGRVGALIQVVEGIHPDLSGRENVYLYGSLLGLPRAAIAQRFDDIVDFAEVGDAIDRQVKFYSSGMKMRLGFSVAAFLEPDILLVDEVLAVGDASFQQKCLDRMRTVLSSGTTLVLVSHDLAAVEAACERGVWLNDGIIEMDGPVRPVLAAYRRHVEKVAEASIKVGEGISITKVEAAGPDGGLPMTNEDLLVRLHVEVDEHISGGLFLGVSEGTSTPVFVVRRDIDLASGSYELTCRIAKLPLPKGRFYVWVGVVGRGGRDLLGWSPAVSFDTVGPLLDPAPVAVARLSPVYVAADWSDAG